MTRNVSVARTFVQWSGDCGNLFKRNSGLSRFKSVLEDSEEGRNWSHFKSNRWNKGQIGNPRHVGIVRKGRYDTRGGRDCEDFAGRPSIERYKGLSSDNGRLCDVVKTSQPIWKNYSTRRILATSTSKCLPAAVRRRKVHSGRTVVRATHIDGKVNDRPSVTIQRESEPANTVNRNTPPLILGKFTNQQAVRIVDGAYALSVDSWCKCKQREDEAATLTCQDPSPFLPLRH